MMDQLPWLSILTILVISSTSWRHTRSIRARWSSRCMGTRASRSRWSSRCTWSTRSCWTIRARGRRLLEEKKKKFSILSSLIFKSSNDNYKLGFILNNKKKIWNLRNFESLPMQTLILHKI